MSECWHRPDPRPVVVMTPGHEWMHLVRNLRRMAGRHDDTAWIHPPPPPQRDGLGPLSQALCDAIGAVGLATPRAAGERHLLRGLVHLIHGPVRHLIVDDVVNLDLPVLLELHQTCILGSTQLWLIVDPADVTRGRRRTGQLLDWVAVAGPRIAPTQALARWQARSLKMPGCVQPEPAHWHRAHSADDPVPRACGEHAAVSENSAWVHCLLVRMRRALTLGHVQGAAAREHLAGHLDHPAVTAADRWALTAASRDVYTPGLDVLAQTHPAGTAATLAQVAHDGSRVLVDNEPHPVPTERRLALARLRTSRRLAGALSHEPINALFDSVPD